MLEVVEQQQDPTVECAHMVRQRVENRTSTDVPNLERPIHRGPDESRVVDDPERDEIHAARAVGSRAGAVGWARAAAKAAAVGYRSAGVLASARSNAWATSGGVPGRTPVTAGGSAMRCWRTMLSAVGPTKGGWPASIS